MLQTLLKVVTNPRESWAKLKAMPYFKPVSYGILGLVAVLLVTNPGLLADLLNVGIKLVQLVMLFAI